jgi:hypothetical protein
MSFLNTPSGLKQILARARVDCGDVVPSGARSISDAVNVASATGSGSSINATLTVLYTSPIADVNYGIDVTLSSNNGANIVSHNTVTWIIQSKDVNGFVVNFREWLSVGQDVSIDFQCWTLS